MAECCCCPESRHSDSRSHMINCFLVGPGTSRLRLVQGLPPSISRRVFVCVVCVCICKRERGRGKEGWWNAKTLKNKRECYVLFYEFVCHCVLSWNMCYCFGGGRAVKWWGCSGWMWWTWSMWFEGLNLSCTLFMFPSSGLCNFEGL